MSFNCNDIQNRNDCHSAGIQNQWMQNMSGKLGRQERHAETRKCSDQRLNEPKTNGEQEYLARKLKCHNHK